MRTAIVGAGPTGLFLATALARRGHQVAIIDRDPGPPGTHQAGADSIDGWDRKGVMQFRLPHFFRPQVRSALLAEAPEVDRALVAACALLAPLSPMLRDFLAYRVRRVTFERVLREATLATAGVSFVAGHASRISVEGRRATGVVVDAATVEADLVIDTTGRSGRLTDTLRAPAVGGDSGFAYAAREYRLHPGAAPGPLNAPPGWNGSYDGYDAIVFLQDAGTFQALVVRGADDRALAELRHDDVFEAVARAIPPMAEWTDPARAMPIGPVLAGAGLRNSYRGQLDADGEVGAHGVLAVGDAVLTTNPADGRGVSTSLLQAQHALALLDEHDRDLDAVVLGFDAWCTTQMKPWFDDQLREDAAQLALWRGDPIDLRQPLASGLICALFEIDPSVIRTVGPYWAMLELPTSLAPLEGQAREAFRSGFRPPLSEGPTRSDLADLAAATIRNRR